MQFLLIINDPPYGTERLYNALRLANTLLKQQHHVTAFLLGDAVAGAKTGQKTPDGFYNIERLLHGIGSRGRLLLCGSCLDARGLQAGELVPGSVRSTIDELAQETVAADKVLVF